ncbi:cation:proton antiporter [Thermodesulfobacterium thermophilum]|uniref:cation:proton antiporter n=1 Tax=Thermodesulfobacterium thermophilum TaxID=886 RepID=UPI0003B5AC6A|nr:cation:proton antiporter [Thermodesulfobacterium thermophilum]
MTLTIIITISCLLLIAYLLDITSSRTKIPSVIVLPLLGWVIRQITIFLDVQLPDFSAILPVLGTIGLILIVLEASLELELNKSKIKLIIKSFLGSLIPMLVLAFSLAYLFHYSGQFSIKDSLINVIPLCVISSAIAIPSARNLTSSYREFIIYESSFSDILGVLFFNFVALNDNFDVYSFGHFGLQLLIIIIISFVATIGLSFILSKIEYHVKLMPIILLVILIYAVSKIYHLPALILILVFGLFIGNLDKLKHLKWIEKFCKLDELCKEVKKFKEFTTEIVFLIRSLFFILFGYLTETSVVLNTETMILAVGIVFGIFMLRAIQLKISNLPLKPLLFIAPRGLITILLFLSIHETQRIPIVNKSLIIQVIILTALVMMIGLMTSQKNDTTT